MSTPLVSVVVPVFNGMSFLAATIDSIRGQDYPNVELVVVDGGSTDGSLDWVRALAGPGVSVNDRAVDVQINRLRRKIERDPANPRYVQTVRGIGYRLMVDP